MADTNTGYAGADPWWISRMATDTGFQKKFGKRIVEAQGDPIKMKGIYDEHMADQAQSISPAGSKARKNLGSQADIVPPTGINPSQVPFAFDRPMDVSEPRRAAAPARELPLPNPTQTVGDILEQAKNSFYYSPSILHTKEDPKLMKDAMTSALSAAGHIVGAQYGVEGDRTRGMFGLAGDETKGEYDLARQKTQGEYGLVGERMKTAAELSRAMMNDDTARAVANTHLLGTQYSADKSASASMYHTDKSASASMYHTDKSTEEKPKYFPFEGKDDQYIGRMDKEGKVTTSPLGIGIKPKSEADLEVAKKKIDLDAQFPGLPGGAAATTPGGTPQKLGPGESLKVDTRTNKKWVVDKKGVIVRSAD